MGAGGAGRDHPETRPFDAQLDGDLRSRSVGHHEGHEERRDPVRPTGEEGLMVFQKDLQGADSRAHDHRALASPGIEPGLLHREPCGHHGHLGGAAQALGPLGRKERNRIEAVAGRRHLGRDPRKVEVLIHPANGHPAFLQPLKEGRTPHPQGAHHPKPAHKHPRQAPPRRPPPSPRPPARAGPRGARKTSFRPGTERRARAHPEEGTRRAHAWGGCRTNPLGFGRTRPARGRRKPDARKR